VLNKKNKITAVHKANIQKLGDGLFLQVGKRNIYLPSVNAERMRHSAKEMWLKAKQ
jgi:isocitrate dehydrogenase